MKEMMFWAVAALVFLGVLGVAAFYEPQLPYSVPEATARATAGSPQVGSAREEAALSTALHEEQGARVAMHPCRWEESCVALCGHGRELCCEGHWVCPAGASGWEQGPLAASTTRHQQ